MRIESASKGASAISGDALNKLGKYSIKNTKKNAQYTSKKVNCFSCGIANGETFLLTLGTALLNLLHVETAERLVTVRRFASRSPSRRYLSTTRTMMLKFIMSTYSGYSHRRIQTRLQKISRPMLSLIITFIHFLLIRELKYQSVV